jgi:biotin carboxylase
MRVLVVGSARACHRRLAAHGHEMALLIPRRQAEPGDLTGPYRYVVVLEDDAGVELWVDFARALHRGAPFDVVVAFNEPTYPVAHAISDALNIPTMVDVKLFGRVVDKSRTRAILLEHDVPTCRYEVVRGRAAIHEAVRRVGFPCIVKPVDGEASAGVAKVGSEADVAFALQRLGDDQIDRGVLVEEFLVGEEFSVEGISAGSQHHIVAVTRKFTDELTFVERGHLVPAPLDHATHESIVDYVRRVLDVVGFHDCPSHTEVVLTDAGPRLVETHNRIAGDSILDLVQLATGIDMYDLVARQSLGENVSALLPDQPAHHQYAAVWFADPSGPSTNTLREVRGVEQVAGLPYVRKVKVLKEPGSPQGPVAQSADRSALVVLVGETAQEALDRARAAIRMLEFVYTWTLPEDSPPASADESGTTEPGRSSDCTMPLQGGSGNGRQA